MPEHEQPSRDLSAVKMSRPLPGQEALGEDGASFYALLQKLVPKLDGYVYPLMDVEEWQQLAFHDPAEGMKVFWEELLYRAHWAGASSLIRSHRWLSGVVDAYEKSNLMMFAAACRGFVESAADTDDALNAVPYSLAGHHRLIRRSLAGKATVFLQAAELERRLLEFTHARRPARNEAAPPNLIRSKSIQDYLAKFKTVDPAMETFYAELCDVTHPGARSVLSFARAVEPNSVVLSPAAEKDFIALLRDALVASMFVTATLGIGVPMILLKVLNTFATDSVRTPLLDGVVLNGMPAWENIRRDLTAQDVRKGLINPSADLVMVWRPVGPVVR